MMGGDFMEKDELRNLKFSYDEVLSLISLISNYLTFSSHHLDIEHLNLDESLKIFYEDDIVYLRKILLELVKIL